MKHKLLAIITLLVIISFSIYAQDTSEEEPEVIQDNIILHHESPPDENLFDLTLIAEGLARPLFITNAGDGSGRLFIVEQAGKIWKINDNSDHNLLETPFLDIADRVTQDGGNYSERGLLGLAFHPNYADNGLFYVNYTASYDSNATKVAEYRVSDDPDIADSESARELITIHQPYSNHNGGHLAFGSDDMLYIATGDGGSRDDPLEAGQNPSNLLGKILRIDIDSTTDDLSYGIPKDNPFTINDALAPEIWAWGLRNPWRLSFDKATGDLYIADVGQDIWEEVNFQPADSVGGENYGWRNYEASYLYFGIGPDDELVMPVIEYDHNFGCSITGGYVYRGGNIPQLDGYYFFSDFCSGTLWAAYRDSEDIWHSDIVTALNFSVSSFGEDENGELYVIDYRAGQIFRFDPAQ